MSIIFFNPTVIFLFAVAVSSFIFSFMVMKGREKRRSYLYFSFALIAIGFWILARTFFLLLANTSVGALFGHAIFIFPMFIMPFLFLFTYYLGHEDRKIKPLMWVYLVVPWATGLLIALLPNGVFDSVGVTYGGVPTVIYGPYFSRVYLPIAFLYLLPMLGLLIYSHSKAHGELLSKLRYILLSFIFSIGVVVIVNLISPLFDVVEQALLGPIAMAVLVITTSYALLRKKFWDFKLVFTETILFTILIFLLFDMIIRSGSLSIFIFKAVALALMSTFSVFLIRGVVREFEAREKASMLATKLTNLNNRLKEIDIEKSDFVSIASHQLRTPLTAVKGYASMLLEGSFGEIKNNEQKKTIAKVLEASDRLVSMIEDFLNISSIDRGEVRYKFKKMNLAALTLSIINDLHITMKEDVSLITHDIDMKDDYMIVGDELKLHHVIVNIIDNAIKYSPQGSPIKISITSPDDSVCLSVTDKGIGISKEVFPALFQKYSRAKRVQKLRTEGRGLGLYLAKKIIIGHGGKIWAKSKGEGQGSTFFVQIPKITSTMRRAEVKEFLSKVQT